MPCGLGRSSATGRCRSRSVPVTWRPRSNAPCDIRKQLPFSALSCQGLSLQVPHRPTDRPVLNETSRYRHGRACPHRHQDKPGRGENICRFRRRLGSARSLCARGSASRMSRGVRPDRPPTTASITSLETRQREQRPWEARSSGGRFQEILANVFGQQNQDQMGIQPTQAACVGAGG
jgi:hypothetical protein